MEISSQRIETFDRIAESFSWALSHSRVSIESLGEFATLLYLIKHDQLRKVSNSDCKEGNDLFVLQFGPSMVAGDMEKWMQKGIACIGLMRKEADPNQEIEAILQRYRTTLRQHQSQDALIRTFDLIKEAQLEDAEYTQLLVHVEHAIAKMAYKVGIEIYLRKQSLCELLASLPYASQKAIYDPFMGIAAFATELPEDVTFYGTDINPEIYQYALLKLALSGRKYQCKQGDSLRDDIHGVPADCIITFPPYISNDPDKSVEHLIQLFMENEHVKELIMIVGDQFVSSSKYLSIRQELTEKDMLDKVLKLPLAYMDGTIGALSIVHLRKDREREAVIFYNFGEDAEKKDKTVDISLGSWYSAVEYDFNRGIVGTILRKRKRIAEENYDWSCDTYPMEDCITGIPYGGETKPFKLIMKRVYGEVVKELPETVLSIRKLNSPFDSPTETTPRIKGTRDFVRVEKPVIIIGYTNNCPLYYLEASKEEPVYLSRREILYQCVDERVDPMYLACIYSKPIHRVTFEEYVYEGAMEPNRKIEKFLLSQEVGLPTHPVQLSRVDEFKDAYYHAQLEDANIAKYITEIKQQYIDEVRSRKHNMRPFLREIKSSVDLARLYLDKASSIEELKTKLSSLLDRIESNGVGLADIVERLSQEDKFEETEYLDVLDELLKIAADYNKNTKLQVFVNKVADYPDVAAMSENSLTWGDYAYISTYDFRRMFNAIIENARIHGFEGQDEGHHIYITIDYFDEHFRISVKNDGLPFPEGFDINTYGQRGGKAGKTAGTGDGGHQVVAIADHFRGWVEINSSKPGAPEQFAEVVVYLRIADKDWDDELSNFIDELKEDDNV